jgi:putative nucleotidyltransferase with HDIG domain
LYTFKYFSRGWLQFISAFIVFISLVITYFGFRFIDALNGNVYQTLLYLFVGSMLSVAGYPLIYLFEKVFNLVSNSRLLELCDTNNPLLRQLESRASGTFQHSLQVMNMADAVAREVGANIPEVRAGALYHDIGKMENPLCFIENETLVAAGPRFHDNLTSQESARLIIKHVPDGLALAEKYKLPDVIKDFIRTHHGTSRTGYFYSKYVSEGGDPADDAEFCYTGTKPSTKEQIILMVCDSVEAASRTLKDFSPESVSAFVRGMVDSKMKAGQFDQADISLKDINTIVSVLEKWLLQSHHGRIEYPKEP